MNKAQQKYYRKDLYTLRAAGATPWTPQTVELVRSIEAQTRASADGVGLERTLDFLEEEGAVFKL